MFRGTFWTVAALLCSPTFLVAGEFDDLLTKAPSTTNVIMFVNGEQLFQSDIAKKENWEQAHDAAYAAGTSAISPNVKRILFAEQLDWEVLQPTWSMAAAELSSPVSLPNIARERKGAIDSFDGHAGVAFRNDTFLVEFGPQLVGVMSPANRQTVARWIRDSSASKTPQLSDFITTAIRDIDQDAITQVVDMEDAFPLDVIKNKLNLSPVMSKFKAPVDPVANVLASIRGMLVEVRLTDRIAGRVILVFKEDVTPLTPVARPLLQEILANNGLAIDELIDWDVEAVDKRVVMKGGLTKAGLKRIFSLVDSGIANFSSTPGMRKEDDKEYMTENFQKPATLKYFRAIQQELTELRGEAKSGATWGSIAQWVDYSARRIDKLPQVDVDSEMLDYSSYVLTQLRAAATSLRGIGIRSGSRTAQVIPETKAHVEASVSPYMYGGPYNGYGRAGYVNGYYEWRDVKAERRAITAEETAQGATDTRGIVTQIEDATSKIRRRMTEKYHTEFK